LKAAKKKRAEMLIEEARQRVERNPTDLQLDLNWENIWQCGRFREALPELQRARQSQMRD